MQKVTVLVAHRGMARVLKVTRKATDFAHDRHLMFAEVKRTSFCGGETIESLEVRVRLLFIPGQDLLRRGPMRRRQQAAKRPGPQDHRYDSA